MDPDLAQRRRVFVAVAVTAVAVPGAFLLNRGGASGDAATATSDTMVDSRASGSTAAGGATGVMVAPGDSVAPATGQASTPAGSAAASDVLGTTPTGYLDGTVPPDDAEPPTIRILRQPDTLTGQATFSEAITDVTKCLIPKAPPGVTATLTNLDNSFAVKCTVTNVAGTPQDAVILSKEAFSEIADITEAPVPVGITWQ